MAEIEQFVPPGDPNWPTYSHTAVCGNCGKSTSFLIPKGTPLSGQVKECRNCKLPIRLRSYSDIFRD